MSSTITLRLTPQQADAVLFAISNTLEEPANFEGTNEHLEAPLRRAQTKLEKAADIEEDKQ